MRVEISLHFPVGSTISFLMLMLKLKFVASDMMQFRTYPSLRSVLFASSSDSTTHYRQQLSRGWHALMYIDIAVLVISLFCYIGTLLLRHKSKSLWLYKTVETPSGNLAVPNTTTLFSSISIVYALIAIPTIVFTIEGYRGNVRIELYGSFYPILWPLSKLHQRVFLGDECSCRRIVVLAVVCELHGLSAFLYMLHAPTSTPKICGRPFTPRLFTSTFMYVRMSTYELSECS